MNQQYRGLANQLCFSAYNVSRLFAQFYEKELKQFGLTYSQYLVLLVLWENDEQPLNVIGQQLDLSSNTLTPLLKDSNKQDGLKENARKRIKDN